MTVDPKFHPKIIGRKGAVISQIRKDHDVNIQFPDKGDEDLVGVFFLVFFWMSLWRSASGRTVEALGSTGRT